MNSRWDPSMAKFFEDFSSEIVKEDRMTFDSIGSAYNDSAQQLFVKNIFKLFNEVKNTKTDTRREEMINMLTDPHTGQELYVDLTMAEKYNFDNDRAYSIEHGDALKIITRFEAFKDAGIVRMVSRLMHQTTQIEEKAFDITEEKLKEVLYELVYVRKEFDILSHEYMKDAYNQVLAALVEGRAAFLEDMKMLKGVGISFDKRNTIINFFNEISITPKSTHVTKNTKQELISINDSDQKHLDCVFVTEAFPGEVIFFTESNKARFAKIDKLPAEIKTALPILQEKETMEKAEKLSDNRQYFYDTIISPIREVTRKESIASQFADIDFDF